MDLKRAIEALAVIAFSLYVSANARRGAKGAADEWEKQLSYRPSERTYFLAYRYGSLLGVLWGILYLFGLI